VTDSFLDDRKCQLLALRASLEASAAAGRDSEAPVALDQARVGRLSRMDALQGQAMAQASGRRRDETMRSITAALARIDRGSFGLCRGCEEPIAEQRLAFDPTVRFCIDCARNAEK
jgi:DnaK suppressor protein